MAIGLIARGGFSTQRGIKLPFRHHPQIPAKPRSGISCAASRRCWERVSISFSCLRGRWRRGGTAPGSDGYGVFQRRNLNGTRYGSLQSLMNTFSALNAHGCRTYADLMLHQMSGENGGPELFRDTSADDKTMNGGGQTTPGWFRGGPIPPFRPEDDVPVVSADNLFDRELSYQHCRPAGVTEGDAVDYLKWSQARTGAMGFPSTTRREPLRHQCGASWMLFPNRVFKASFSTATPPT